MRNRSTLAIVSVFFGLWIALQFAAPRGVGMRGLFLHTVYVFGSIWWWWLSFLGDVRAVNGLSKSTLRTVVVLMVVYVTAAVLIVFLEGRLSTYWQWVFGVIYVVSGVVTIAIIANKYSELLNLRGIRDDGFTVFIKLLFLPAGLASYQNRRKEIVEGKQG